jgi:molecular chaperone DnaJ
MKVSIPKGAGHGMKIRLKGVGNYSVGANAKGHIHFILVLAEHELFAINGSDVHAGLPITFKQAILGGDIKVPTLYGDVDVTLPKESKNGDVLTVSGSGVPNKPNSTVKGDQYVHLIVDMPKGVSDEIREVINGIDDSGCTYETINEYNGVCENIKKEIGRANNEDKTG